MKLSIILHAAATSLVQAAAQDYIRVTSALTDYGIDEMQWILKPAFGEPLLINGTLQEIEDHLEGSEILQLPPRPRAERSAAHDQRYNIGREVNTVKFCGVFPMADAHHIAALVPAIGVISGPAVIGPGPGNCAQVSCAQNSAIWWCNDRNITIKLPQGTQELGDAVEAIIDQCCKTTNCQSSPNYPISGQAFSDEGWNVLMRGESC
ncbi:hypothetical protein J7T55_010366 [Diaporthe amygdali]|uniref:uncharacterized protein n=1 Tax=Phomopsis amygdali TaxID=1214568 RepID=UPI0022FE63D9|nr:uncharacterized protein J7T55_010366 [Diaporthe amygdali]KAJ0115544.1 hypothetical protein J7T55_010366 [Diaporthe amygdali]